MSAALLLSALIWDTMMKAEAYFLDL